MAQHMLFTLQLTYIQALNGERRVHSKMETMMAEYERNTAMPASARA